MPDMDTQYSPVHTLVYTLQSTDLALRAFESVQQAHDTMWKARRESDVRLIGHMEDTYQSAVVRFNTLAADAYKHMAAAQGELRALRDSQRHMDQAAAKLALARTHVLAAIDAQAAPLRAQLQVLDKARAALQSAEI